MATTQVANRPHKPPNEHKPKQHDATRQGGDPAPAEDLVIPFTGVLAVQDKQGFVRTDNYHPGPDDVHVSLAQIRAYGLRPGDMIEGTARPSRQGQPRQSQRDKPGRSGRSGRSGQSGQSAQPGRNGGDGFNALIHVETVNGTAPEEARGRLEFGKLTPLFPQDRLHMDNGAATTRIIDLVAPIGKGQRGLIVSPPKAGKTMVLQAIANAIVTGDPECHLMVVLIDERPEEVTDMQRSIVAAPGAPQPEVIHSTFDRPPKDHVALAELAIERAKRLVELGHDVVVMLDSMTRLGRSYNQLAPNNDRVLAGGVAASALSPPKRFFGAARNIEHGGSLTILATALVENESRMDEVFFEEFKGTGNMEIVLNRQLAAKRVFPAIDLDASSTRREELMVPTEELELHWRLRRALHTMDRQQAVEQLLDGLKDTSSNVEFLLKVQQTT